MSRSVDIISGHTRQMAYPVYPASSCPSCFVAEIVTVGACLAVLSLKIFVTTRL